MWESDVGKSRSTHARVRDAYRVLDRKPERNRPFGRPRRGWKDALR
jgi:hypothetical protein